MPWLIGQYPGKRPEFSECSITQEFFADQYAVKIADEQKPATIAVITAANQELEALQA